ncbi:carbohydrate sulfotransferase 14-like isoform X2 [Oratosquilla oratoria]|uniref:carbohydrate sulfotransferase 14-like isoform X2 n=1 Tax=Oratosquilla oratoria TaxID=337810 RepID=UPI003F778095
MVLGMARPRCGHNADSKMNSITRPPAPRWGRALLYAVIAILGISYTVLHTTVLESPLASRSILPTNSAQCPPSAGNNEVRVLPRLESGSGPEVRARWEALQAQRRTRVQSACEQFDISQNYSYDLYRHLLVDETHKIVFCFVPKVACTSWRRMWLWLTNLLEDDEDIMEIPRKTVHGSLIPSLTHVSDELREEALKNYRKFLFIRNPFDRVVSAYRDKLENTDTESVFDFHANVGVEIERLIRGKETGGHNVTFSEFIRWVSKPREQELLELEKKEGGTVAEQGVDGKPGGGSDASRPGGEQGNDEGQKSIVEQEKRLEALVSDDEEGKRNEEPNKEGGGKKEKRKDEKKDRVKRSNEKGEKDGGVSDNNAIKSGEADEKKKKIAPKGWTEAQWNEHWRPVVDICAPCLIKYDVIGSYENLLTEVDFVLDWMGAGDFRGRFPSADRPFHASKYHKSYWQKLLPQEKKSFMQAYLVDYLLFGYDFLQK